MIALYEPQDAQRNRAFIEELQRFGEVELVTLETWEESGLERFAERAGDEPVLFRARRPEAARFLEDRGVRLVNRAEVNRIANDKWQAFQLFLLLGVPAIPTSKTPPGFPCVVKPAGGHGGTGVEIIESAGDYGPDTLFQPLIDHVADVRIYVIGKEVAGAVKRVPDGSFKANIAHGGKAEKFVLSTEQEQQALTIARALKSDYIGIDFLLLPDGRHLFNEIEDPVGARAFYQTHEMNIAELLVRHIESKDGWL